MTKKIFIMAGGTGGHVFPGIAIAKALQKHNIEVRWLGSEGSMETTLVPKAGLSLQALAMTGFRGKSFFNKLCMPAVLFKAVMQAYRIFQQEKPDAVLGMGGFAAAPGGIAAKLLGIPLLIHEQNSIAGWTNKILARFAGQIFCAFPGTFPASYNSILTGNPVREEIQKLSPKAALHHPPRLLIMGGSRGAAILNDTVPQAIALLPESFQIEIYHQTGQSSSAQYNRPATVVPFIDDMAKVYDWADFVICRAGALTLAELTTIGLPAILVPYPHAVDDHQTINAQYLEKNGAAFLLPHLHLTAEQLNKILLEILSHPSKYRAMATASRNLNQRNSTQIITDLILLHHLR